MVVNALSTKVLRQPRFRVFVIPRGRPANRALETWELILNRSWVARKQRRREAKGLIPKRQWTWVCRKGNDDEKPPCCRCCWNSGFTKTEPGYNMDAGIEVGIQGNKWAGVDDSSGWEMRHRWSRCWRLYLDICRRDHGWAYQGKGGGCSLNSW